MVKRTMVSKVPPRWRKTVIPVLSAIAIIAGIFLLRFQVQSAIYGSQRVRPKEHGNSDYTPCDPSAHTNFAERKVTAIVMNHKRPTLLQRSTLLATLTAHPRIQTVLILHSNRDTAFDDTMLQKEVVDTGKVVHIDASVANKALGLGIRWHYCAANVTTPLVMHVDDDQELYPSAIDKLLCYMDEDSTRIVGAHGRDLSMRKAPLTHGYSANPMVGHVEVVLTKLMIMEPVVCNTAQFLAPMFSDIVAGSRPLWNGEDIFMNLVANKMYGVPYDGPWTNVAVPDVSVWESKYSLDMAKLSISGDRNRLNPIAKLLTSTVSNKAYRGKMWKAAKNRMYGH